MDLYKVLVAIRQLLAEPNPKDPLVVDIVSTACMAHQGVSASSAVNAALILAQ